MPLPPIGPLATGSPLLDAIGQAIPQMAPGAIPPSGGLPPPPPANAPTGHGDQFTRITPEGQTVIPREKPEPDERRKRLVSALADMIKQAKSNWEKTFEKMEDDQRFCAGRQWPEDPKRSAYNDIYDDDLYVANITLQHIQKRTALLYAKNPKAVAKKRSRLLATVWDGSLESLAQAESTVQQAKAALMGMQPGMPASPAGGPAGALGAPPGPMPPESGMPPGAPPGLPGAMPGPVPPAPPPPMPAPDEMMNAQAVMADAQAVKQQIAQLNKIGKTLELLYEYEISEQQQNFKSMMKMTVRRAATSGVGWVRLGFQRIMGPNPDRDSRIADMQQQLDLVERISADIADSETTTDSASAEELRLTMQAIAEEGDVVLREGLQFSWPKSTAIIVDPRCIQLRDFLGCDWVAEEYILTVNEIKETYNVDVGKSHTSYSRTDTGTDYERARVSWQVNATSGASDPRIDEGDADNCVVWELFNKRDGLVYVLCDGYSDFLKEPAAPDVYTDRFWPWFLTAFNETDGRVYPPSDVALIRPMQRELNRSRQGLREHRFANRPKMAYAEGTLSEDDLEALKSHPVNALIAVSGLQPGQDINQVLQAIKGVPVDPNLYEVNPIFQDLLRAVGDQEADLGGTGGATATESNIAASAKSTALSSSIDDIDDTLTGIARAAGQILLLNMSEETVKQIVGPGAMWPVLTKADVAKEIFLEVEAGSSGRPNQAQQLQNFERLAPILMQIPGVKPQFLAKEAIKRMDDRIDTDEAVAEGLPSVISMNGGKSITGTPGEPSAQGPAGGNNNPAAPQPSPSSPTPPQKPQLPN
jgi:hypothetical protein